MTLTFVSEPRLPSRFPYGYWYARTDDGDHDAVGATPVDALAALVTHMEQGQ